MTRAEALNAAIGYAISQQEDRINWARGVREVKIAVRYDVQRDLPMRIVISEETETTTEVWETSRENANAMRTFCREP